MSERRHTMSECTFCLALASVLLWAGTTGGGLATVRPESGLAGPEGADHAEERANVTGETGAAGAEADAWGEGAQYYAAFRAAVSVPGDDGAAGDWGDEVATTGEEATEPVRLSGSAAKDFEPFGKERGFEIRTVKAASVDGWDRDEMNKLLDFGCTGPLCMAPGMPEPGIEDGRRTSQYVNLFDSGDRGAFTVSDDWPDAAFPGIDPIEWPAADPAAADDDDAFATEVMAVIHLTEGLHVIGVNDADGTIIEIGGIEIGRTPEWKEASNSDFSVEVEVEGYYTLRVRHLAGIGPATLELHELVETEDGTWERILLGDVASGGSLVYAPEPATIVLIGLGALVLVRRRPRSGRPSTVPSRSARQRG
jgi:hypothetical protein